MAMGDTYRYETPPVQTWNFFNDCLSQKHLLIAGQQGSGKSVFLHGLMTTILADPPCKRSFVCIDLKQVELCRYANVPHCLGYAETIEQATSLLNNMTAKIKERYADMKARGLRKYDGGIIYIVIDELADLLLEDRGRKVEHMLSQIAMLGRACNIWLIAATQLPSRKTLPATITANMSAQIALHCRSGIESRQVITGFSGAVDLPRYGECYYMNPDLYEPEKWKVPFTTDEQIDELVEWWQDSKHYKIIKKASKPHWWQKKKSPTA